MKKLTLILILALAFAMPNNMFAQGSCSFATSIFEEDPCCIAINAGCDDDEAWHLVVTNPDGSTVTYNAGNVPGTFFTHCGDPGVYTIQFFVFNDLWWTNTETIIEDDCGITTPDCVSDVINCPESGDEVGDWTVCCDGSLTVNSTAIATYVKVFNISATLCEQLNGQVDGNACILCGLWNNNAPCDGGNWELPAGTVTETSQTFLEFQSNSPWHEFDCDWNGTGQIPISEELAALDCGPECDLEFSVEVYEFSKDRNCPTGICIRELVNGVPVNIGNPPSTAVIWPDPIWTHNGVVIDDGLCFSEEDDIHLFWGETVQVTFFYNDGECEVTLDYTIPCEGFDGGGSNKNDGNESTRIMSDINLSPNPTNSFVNISNPDARNISIKIYNTNGQRLLTQSVNQTIGKIDINTLAHGLYLVHIQDTETQEYISIEKLIVTK